MNFHYMFIIQGDEMGIYTKVGRGWVLFFLFWVVKM